jgi:hypothetical protein
MRKSIANDHEGAAQQLQEPPADRAQCAGAENRKARPREQAQARRADEVRPHRQRLQAEEVERRQDRDSLVHLQQSVGQDRLHILHHQPVDEPDPATPDAVVETDTSGKEGSRIESQNFRARYATRRRGDVREKKKAIVKSYIFDPHIESIYLKNSRIEKIDTFYTK